MNLHTAIVLQNLRKRQISAIFPEAAPILDRATDISLENTDENE